MKICELFASIQGESTLQGLPTVFIRLAGCNLDCRYCDTRYARTESMDMTVSDIIREVTAHQIPVVCITGGEPLLQEETPALASALLDKGYMVSVETNGTIDAGCLDERLWRIIDIKCPGSGESGKTHPANITQTRPSDEFKFVITDREDYDYARRFVQANNLDKKGTVLLSPAAGYIDYAALAEWMLADMRNARLNLQLHKIIWPDETKGK